VPRKCQAGIYIYRPPPARKTISDAVLFSDARLYRDDFQSPLPPHTAAFQSLRCAWPLSSLFSSATANSLTNMAARSEPFSPCHCCRDGSVSSRNGDNRAMLSRRELPPGVEISSCTESVVATVMRNLREIFQNARPRRGERAFHVCVQAAVFCQASANRQRGINRAAAGWLHGPAPRWLSSRRPRPALRVQPSCRQRRPRSTGSGSCRRFAG